MSDVFLYVIRVVININRFAVRWFACPLTSSRVYCHTSVLSRVLSYFSFITCVLSYFLLITCVLSYFCLITCTLSYFRLITCALSYFRFITCPLCFCRSCGLSCEHQELQTFALHRGECQSTWQVSCGTHCTRYLLVLKLNVLAIYLCFFFSHIFF